MSDVVRFASCLLAFTISFPNWSWQFLLVLTCSPALLQVLHLAENIFLPYVASWQCVVINFFCVNNEVTSSNVNSGCSVVCRATIGQAFKYSGERWMNEVWRAHNDKLNNIFDSSAFQRLQTQRLLQSKRWVCICWCKRVKKTMLNACAFLGARNLIRMQFSESRQAGAVAF